MQNLKINGDRLWQSLMEMAEIGATEKGGNRRVALTDYDKEGRNLFVRWCEAAGCTVTVDKMGSIFARRPGRNNDLPPIMSGSHLDTQPTGGKFDGVFGVLAALEMVRTMNDYGIETEAPVEIVCWTNEEGARFQPPMIASGVFAGVFTLEQGLACTDVDGKILGEELKRIGYAGEAEVGDRPVGGFFEIHIEQGPILENEDKLIGVVTGAQAQRWYEITVTGRESHAGTTPMELRRDALVGAAQMFTAIDRIGRDHAPDARTTIGYVDVRPGSRNTIPGEVFFSVDCRHPDDAVLTRMDQEIRAACGDIASEAGLEVAVSEFWYTPPVAFDPECIQAVREGAQAAGYPLRELISGAGHDAVYMAKAAPTAMIFVPCKDGLSHNELESAEPEHLAAGCDVLMRAVLSCAKVL